MAIRTKESVQYVRYHNNGSKLNHALQQHAIHSSQNRKSKESSAEASATNSVQTTAASSTSELAYRIKRHVTAQSEKRQNAKQEGINNSRNRNAVKNNYPEKIKNAPKPDTSQITFQARNSTINKAKQQSANKAKDTFTYILDKAESMIITAFNAIKAGFASSSNALIMGIAGSTIVVIIVICSFFGTGGGEALDQPNFFNLDAYVLKNPYAQSGLYGQCTWFAWGRFYELYGYSPGFTGDGWHCAEQLVEAHPDTWELSDTPTDLCVFSGVGFNHVGIVLYYHNGILTIQHGNMDGETNTFEDATKDWCEMQISLDEIRDRYDGVVFAVPK